MIRILHMTGSLGWHGVEAVAMNYYRSIDREKVQFDFVVASEKREKFDDEVERLGGKIYRLPPRNRHPLKYTAALKKLFAEHPEYRVFHAHGNSASIYMDLRAAKGAGVSVRIAHSHNTSCFVKWQHYLLKPYLNGACTYRFACSAEAGRWLFGGRGDVRIIKNAIDLDKFAFNGAAREEIRGRLNIAPGAFVVGHIGDLTPNKNHSFLLKAFAEYLKMRPGKASHESKLLLVGQGGMKGALEKEAADLGIADKAVFFGVTDAPEKLYSAFDVFAFPSLYEGLPLAVVEAAASGLPCLVSAAVTREVAVAESVKFLPIDGPALWAEEMQACQEGLNKRLDNAAQAIDGNERLVAAQGVDGKENRLDNTAQIERNGYNIKKAAAELQNFYEQAAREL